MDKVINRVERELPLLTLTEGCASKKLVWLSKVLVTLSDILLSYAMKIDGNGILKVIQRRRGHSLVRDIGLKLTYLNMVNLGRIKVRPMKLHQPESDLPSLPGFSFVSDEKSEGK